MVASTTFVPGVTELVREPTTTFWVDDAVLVGVLLKLDWVVVPPAFCCSKRFYNVIIQELGEETPTKHHSHYTVIWPVNLNNFSSVISIHNMTKSGLSVLIGLNFECQSLSFR